MTDNTKATMTKLVPTVVRVAFELSDRALALVEKLATGAVTAVKRAREKVVRVASQQAS